MALYNLAGFKTTTLGTADVVFSAPVTALNTFPLAGVPNGSTVTYMLENFDGGGNVDAREVGRGVWNSGTLTLARTTVLDTTNGGAKIVLGGNAEARITAIAQDFSASAVGAPALVTPSVVGNFVSFSNVTGGQADSGVSIASFQPIDATLTSIAGLGTAADKMIYTTGVDTWAETNLTAFARTILDDANAAAVLTTLGAQSTLTFPLASTLGGTGVNNAGTLTNASNTTITGGGAVALGGFTLTVPATGTVDLLGTAQTITATKTFTTTQFIDSSADAIELRLQAHSSKTTNYLTIETSAAAVLSVIDENGWIGIGTDTPTTPIRISTSAGNSTNGGFSISYVSSYTGSATQRSGNISIQTPNGTNASSSYTALYGNAQSGSSAATISTLYAVEANLLWQPSSGTVSEAAGVSSTVRNTSGGTITVAEGVLINSGINSGGGTVSTLYGLRIQNQNVGTTNYAIHTGIGLVSLLGSETKASAAGAVWNGIELRAATATITGSTNITTATGFNYHSIAQPTLSAASALTVTNAATLYIAAAPVGAGAGPATITNAYSIWVDAGLSRFDGGIAIDGATAQNVTSGVYTPTRSAEANLDANVTMTEAQYMRVGNTVTVSGRFTADPTLPATSTSFEITLPVASNVGAVEDVAGTAFCGNIAAQGAEVTGSVANNTAVITWKSGDTTSQSWSYIFAYQVI